MSDERQRQAIDVAGDDPEVAAADAIADGAFGRGDCDIDITGFPRGSRFVDGTEALHLDRKVAAGKHSLPLGRNDRQPVEAPGTASNAQWCAAQLALICCAHRLAGFSVAAGTATARRRATSVLNA